VSQGVHHRALLAFGIGVRVAVRQRLMDERSKVLKMLMCLNMSGEREK